MTRQKMFDELSRLINYPNENYKDFLSEFKINLKTANEFYSAKNSDSIPKENLQSITERYIEFYNSMKNLSREELEELYTQTFDINPVSSLEIGWHLFGETYERGTFLVKMRETLRELAVEESSELPDHITHILLAISRMEGEEQSEFSEIFLAPALNKIIDAFEGKNNPYENLLRIISILIKVNRTSELGVI